jgi:hypothetical protein
MQDALIQRLPRDIQLHILGYTYQCQPPILLRDIRFYSLSLDYVINLYTVFYQNNYHDWYDQILYYRTYAMIGLYWDLFHYLFQLSSENGLDESVFNEIVLYDNVTKKQRIRLFWAKLHPIERNLFLNWAIERMSIT